MQTGLDEIFNNRETLINFMNKNTKKNSKEKVMRIYNKLVIRQNQTKRNNYRSF